MQAALHFALPLVRDRGGERRPVLRGACTGDRRTQIVASHLVPAHLFVLALWPAGPVNCLQLRDQAAPPLASSPFPCHQKREKSLCWRRPSSSLRGDSAEIRQPLSLRQVVFAVTACPIIMPFDLWRELSHKFSWGLR